MSTKTWRKNAWEYQFRSALLDGVKTRRFKNEAEGDRFAADMDKSLAAGVVPEALKSTEKEARRAASAERWALLKTLIADYQANNSITVEDRHILRLVRERLPGNTKVADVDFDWVERLIRSMKVDYQLAPGTIRKYAGALSRCLDWGINKKRAADNPFRRLKRGFTSYTPEDVRLGAVPKIDQERDRRLSVDEEARIRHLLDGHRPAGRQRPVAQEHNAEMRLLFELALETGMRMREMYTLTTDQISLRNRTIFLTKTKNGDNRQVPLSTRAVEAIELYLSKEPLSGPLFPCWAAESEKELRGMTSRISRLFQTLFSAAGCEDLHFHDLRHEAISRLFENTQLSEFEIAKISGHRTTRMLMRYANLRGCKLADKLR